VNISAPFCWFSDDRFGDRSSECPQSYTHRFQRVGSSYISLQHFCHYERISKTSRLRRRLSGLSSIVPLAFHNKKTHVKSCIARTIRIPSSYRKSRQDIRVGQIQARWQQILGEATADSSAGLAVLPGVAEWNHTRTANKQQACSHMSSLQCVYAMHRTIRKLQSSHPTVHPKDVLLQEMRILLSRQLQTAAYVSCFCRYLEVLALGR
jgi:hypothetical protein